jgi:ketosteroid isomerase-like protein
VTVAEQQSRPLFETLRPAYEAGIRAWNEGDFRAAYGAFPEDFELRLASTWPNTKGTLRGPDEIVAFFEEFREMFPDARVDRHEFVEVDGHRGIVGFRVTGTGRSSGVSTETEIWQLWEVTEDLVPIRMTEYDSRQAALEAAGIEPGEETS